MSRRNGTVRGREIPGRPTETPGPFYRIGTRGLGDPHTRHGRDAVARQVSCLRISPKEGAEHDSLRRDCDARISMRTMQILDGTQAARPDAGRVHEALLTRVRYEGAIPVPELLKEV